MTNDIKPDFGSYLKKLKERTQPMVSGVGAKLDSLREPVGKALKIPQDLAAQLPESFRKMILPALAVGGGVGALSGSLAARDKRDGESPKERRRRILRNAFTSTALAGGATLAAPTGVSLLSDSLTQTKAPPPPPPKPRIKGPGRVIVDRMHEAWKKPKDPGTADPNAQSLASKAVETALQSPATTAATMGAGAKGIHMRYWQDRPAALAKIEQMLQGRDVPGSGPLRTTDQLKSMLNTPRGQQNIIKSLTPMLAGDNPAGHRRGQLLAHQLLGEAGYRPKTSPQWFGQKLSPSGSKLLKHEISKQGPLARVISAMVPRGKVEKPRTISGIKWHGNTLSPGKPPFRLKPGIAGSGARPAGSMAQRFALRLLDTYRPAAAQAIGRIGWPGRLAAMGSGVAGVNLAENALKKWVEERSSRR
jgi:hypothetical protein